MGGGQSVTRIKIFVEDQGSAGKKLIKRTYIGDSDNYNQIEFSINEVIKLGYTDNEWEKIKEKGYQDIEYCILDNETNGIGECIGLFSDTNTTKTPVLDQFRVVKGPETCKSYFYRPGSVITDKNLDKFAQELNEPINGKKCRIVFQDYNYNDENLERCCFSDNKMKCNKHLINDYTTPHCNVIMSNKCKEDPENPKCLLWLENTYTDKRMENSALELYSELCSKNHNNTYCDYLCRVARQNNDYRGSFCDKALKNWCKENNHDTRCHCVFTPTENIPDLEQYLGPKECWLSNCTGQPNNKWLLTEQIETRSKCQITSCIINIEQLTLQNNAKAQLINDCVSGTSVNSSFYNTMVSEEEQINKILTPGIFFLPEIGLILSGLILLMLIK